MQNCPTPSRFVPCVPKRGVGGGGRETPPSLSHGGPRQRTVATVATVAVTGKRPIRGPLRATVVQRLALRPLLENSEKPRAAMVARVATVKTRTVLIDAA